jgi:hypothetical protein
LNLIGKPVEDQRDEIINAVNAQRFDQLNVGKKNQILLRKK